MSTFYAEAFKGAITPLLAAGFVLIPLPFFCRWVVFVAFHFLPALCSDVRDGRGWIGGYRMALG